VLLAIWQQNRSAVSYQKGRAWIELDMENLRHNVKVLRSILPQDCALMPVVKANAYGHGATDVCREFYRLGVRAFCVATVIEGVELRRRIKGDILILGYTHPEQFYLLRRYRLTQTVIDYAYAKTMHDYGKKLTAHIKIDTGMNRLGEPSQNIGNILQMFAFKNLMITGIYTHFSEQNSSFTQTQTNRFIHVLVKIKERGLFLPPAHIQSSYGVLNRQDLAFDYARVGIALYGAYTGFKPVLSLKARISAVKVIPAGEAVGYGAAFTAPEPMKIAVLSIGYADGVPRSLSRGTGSVLINGITAPVVGCVCMDQIIVDATHIPNIKQNGIATIIGKDGDKEITVFDMAKQAGTIPNEILSRLGSRLERHKIL
jgi:serine/alanine racemase